MWGGGGGWGSARLALSVSEDRRRSGCPRACSNSQLVFTLDVRMN